MKIYALNGMQSHCDSVKKNVSLVGSVVLRGFETDKDIQLLEGSHRMAYAIELGLPITVVLFGEDEIILHDTDNVESPTTGLSYMATVKELVTALMKERGLYNQAVYESDDYPNIKILKTNGEKGEKIHAQLISDSPFAIFPELVWVITFGLLKNVVGKNVLVLGDSKAAESFKRMGANVTCVDSSEYEDINLTKLMDNQFELIYTADKFCRTYSLQNLFSEYKRLLSPGGVTVMLNKEQPSELISAAGLSIYAILEIQDECQKVSFSIKKEI
jgi:hypothetical protein